MIVAGWDIGGAHLKAALVRDGVVEAVRIEPCALWQGMDRLDAAIDRWVADLAALPPIPLTALKRVLNGAYEMPMSIGLQFEGQTFEKLRPGPEFKHGVESFLQKKKPDFSQF